MKRVDITAEKIRKSQAVDLRFDAFSAVMLSDIALSLATIADSLTGEEGATPPDEEKPGNPPYMRGYRDGYRDAAEAMKGNEVNK